MNLWRWLGVAMIAAPVVALGVAVVRTHGWSMLVTVYGSAVALFLFLLLAVTLATGAWP